MNIFPLTTRSRRGLPLLALIFLLWAGFAIADTKDKIAPLIFAEIDTTGQTRFIIYMKEKANLNTAGVALDWNTKGRLAYDALRSTAARSQAPLLHFLNERMQANAADDIQSYWICNCIAVTGDRDTLLAVADRPEVSRITANHELQIIDPNELQSAQETTDAAPAAVEWNIAKVRADQVWSTYGITGVGITIGDMDTGADWTHPALQRKYRGWNGGQVDHNYNWFDAATGRRVPFDNQAHGTHTLGTIIGDDGGGNQIGGRRAPTGSPRRSSARVAVPPSWKWRTAGSSGCWPLRTWTGRIPIRIDGPPS